MAERIIDACCLINLYASGEANGIFQACGGYCVSDQVRGEVLRVHRIDEDDPKRLAWQEIDLSDAIAGGLIETCQLEGQDELNAFVQFAVRLDDGEASCLAIAQSRGWAVATDDRKARRIASENGIALISTPEMLQKWATATSADESVIIERLRRIELFARFRPRRADPLHAWWVGLSDRGNNG